MRVLYKHQKHKVALFSHTNFVVIVHLKLSGFSIGFTSIFKIMSHNLRAHINIMYSLFVSLKEDIDQQNNLKHKSNVLLNIIVLDFKYNITFEETDVLEIKYNKQTIMKRPIREEAGL